MSDTILLVEDSLDDVLFLRRAFKRAQITIPIHVARDGQEALDYLSGMGRFRDREQFPIPSLVLLDLKLPYVPGLDVLEWIRNHPCLRILPVIILTSSSETVDMERAYQIGANSYMVKPSNPDQLYALAKAFGDYWLKLNVLPRAS